MTGVRTYRAPRVDEIEGAESSLRPCSRHLEETRTAHRRCLTSDMTKVPVPNRSGSLVYGIDTFRGLFNDRQLYVLGLLCEAVRAAMKQMLAEGMESNRAVAVATYLGLCVDRIADYNSSSLPGCPLARASDTQHVPPAGDRNGMGLSPKSTRSRTFRKLGGAVRWIELGHPQLLCV